MLQGLFRVLVLESSYLWKQAFCAMAYLGKKKKKKKKQNAEKLPS